MKKLFFILLSFSFLSSSLHAAGNSAGTVLTQGPSARPMGMAEAYASIGCDEGGVTAVQYNPGAAGYLKRSELSMMGRRGFADDTFGSFFLGVPTWIGTFSGSLLYYGVGDIELIDTEGVSRTVKAEQDTAVSLSYSEVIAGRYGTGMTVKFLNTKLVETYESTAFAMDIGVQGRFMTEDRLSIGLSALNIGSNVRFSESDDPLPLTIRAGSAYRFDAGGEKNTIGSFDLIRETGQDVRAFFGLEYIWNKTAALRAGYKTGQQVGSLNFGTGFFLGDWNFEYSFTDDKDLGATHSGSVGFRFGEARRTRRQIDEQVPDIAPRKKALQFIPVKRDTVLILELQPKGVSANDAAAVSEILATEFSRWQETFQVVPTPPGLPPCNEAQCAVKIGNEIGADKVVTGSLGKFGNHYIIHLRIVDTRTRLIEHADSAGSLDIKNMESEVTALIEKYADYVHSSH